MKRIFAAVITFVLLAIISVPCSAVSCSAQSAVLINGATGEIIWSKEPHKRLSMASTTKIMTALLLCENADLEQTIVTTKEMVTIEGSSMGLKAGDTVSYRDLLYGMMLASGNDAANTTALSLAGSAEKFADMMNEKAKEIGMENTNFVTASGLDDDNHYSTAYDMALLAAYALKNKEFAAAASSKTAMLQYGNPPYKRTLSNHNRLLKSYDGAIGVKTGYTKKSGRCLVSAARRENGYLIAVTLNCPSDWEDHTALLDFGFSCLEKRETEPCEMKLSVVGSDKEEINVESEKATLSLTADEWQKLYKKVYLPPFVYSGVEKGDKLGRVDYLIDGKVISSCEILAAQSAPTKQENKNQILKYLIMLFKAMV